MAISNKKKKAILRGYPEKSVKDLANELDLSEREVRGVLKESKRVSRRSLKVPVIVAASIIAVAVLAFGIHSLLNRPSRARLARLGDSMNVLVVTIDTLRADHLGCYGYSGARTPVIDSIAGSGVLFESAFAHQPITLPSHATIFTGTHPAFHGIEDNGFYRLPDEAVTLAEAVREKGLTTGAVVASYVLHRQYGLDQGFDDYDDRLSQRGLYFTSPFWEMPATEVSNRAIAWINDKKDKRWMLWLHYFDPHSYYLPPERFNQGVPGPYDGEIAYVDFELGRVIEALEKQGLREKTLLVVTSDHGEGLGEHGESTHMIFLYDSTVRVPLIFSLPGAIPTGRRTDMMVALMDLMPTVLDALGIESPGEVQGRSFLSLLYSDSDWEEKPVLMETMSPWNQYGWSPSQAVRDRDFKYIRSPKPELYDLRADRRERENIYEREHGRAKAMAMLFSKTRDEYSAGSLASLSMQEIDEKSRERLASLGYVFTGARKEPSITAPDSKDMVMYIAMMDQAKTLKNGGQVEEAVSLMQRVLEKNPDNRRVMIQLSSWLESSGQNEEAEKILKKLIQIDPEFEEAYYNLGVIYNNTGRPEMAQVLADTLIDRNPSYAKAYSLMGVSLDRRGEWESAIPYFKTAVELFPTYDEAWFNLGIVYKRLGNYQEAMKAFEAAYRIVPTNEKYKKYMR